MTKWLDYSEIVTGLVLKNRLDPNSVNPEDLYGDYANIIPILRNGGALEDVIDKCGLSEVRAAQHAVDSINGELKPLAWLKLLEQSASKYKHGMEIGRIAQKLQDGDDVELGKLLQLTSQIDLGYRGMTPLSEVEPMKNPWIKTGYEPIDSNIGGIPKAGLVLIAASPGIGKTTLGLKIGLSMVRKYKKKKVAIYTLEMLMSQLVQRYLGMDESVTLEERARILASETSYSVNEIYALASQTAATEDLACIIIDFADLMVSGEQTESVMGAIYRALSVLAKQTGVPVILICQLNRSTYTGGLPKINHIRYSGMAEAMASLILLLYNPNAIMADFKSENTLIAEEGIGYILVGKSRFGFKMGVPGAIKVPWDGLAGWGDTSQGYFNVNV